MHMRMAGGDEITGKAYDGRLMRRLWTYIQPHQTLVLIALGLLVVTSVADLAGPVFTQQAIDHNIRPRHLQGYERLAGLWLLVLIMNFGARYGESFVLTLLGQRVMFDLRNAVFGHLQRLPLRYFDTTPVGVLVTRLTNDVDALNQLLTSGLIAVIGDLLSLVIIAGFLLLVNWPLALVVFAVMPVVAAVTILVRRRMRDVFRAIRTRIGRINGFLQEAVSGMLVLQLFNREQRAHQDFQVLNDDLMHATLRSVLLFGVFMPVMSFIGSLTVALILWVGAGRVVQGVLTLGTVSYTHLTLPTKA